MSRSRAARTRHLVVVGFFAAVFCVMVAGLAGASNPIRLSESQVVAAVDGVGATPPEAVAPGFELLFAPDVIVGAAPVGPTEEERQAPEPKPGPLALPTPVEAAQPDPPPPEQPVAASAITEPDPVPAVQQGATQRDLELLLTELVDEIQDQSPGAVASISVSADGIGAGVAADTSFVAASVAKVYWVVAAVNAVGPGPVAAHAEAVFGQSDNDAAGLMIDVVGVDVINGYTGALGLEQTYLSAWAYGKGRYATDRTIRGTNNTTSTGDLVSFLDQLVAGDLLSVEAADTVLGWMTWAPDQRSDADPYGAAVVDALPASNAALSSHKAGWLPPGCCTLIGNVLTGAGIIPLGDGSTFAIALAASNGADYDAQVDWAGRATCRVWALLSGADESSCRSTDISARL